MNRPFLSIIVLAYNQANYIRDAIESALAQTYSPLEIIVADDASKDKTPQIAREILRSYRGPHSVQLLQNDRNVGLAEQLNKVMSLCKGELILVAAGDDISMPKRAEVCCQAWLESGRRATSIFSSYTIISETGVVEGLGGLRRNNVGCRPFTTLIGSLPGFLSTKQPAVNGCTHAWTPELFRYFGSLTSDLEDLVLSFRTLAIGDMVYIKEPLVKYRRHKTNVSFLAEWDDTKSFEQREHRLRWVDAQSVKAYENILRDITTLKKNGDIHDLECRRLKEMAIRHLEFYRLESELLKGDLLKRLQLLGNATVRGEFRLAMRFAHRGFPRNWYRKLYRIRHKYHAQKKRVDRSY